MPVILPMASSSSTVKCFVIVLVKGVTNYSFCAHTIYWNKVYKFINTQNC